MTQINFSRIEGFRIHYFEIEIALLNLMIDGEPLDLYDCSPVASPPNVDRSAMLKKTQQSQCWFVHILQLVFTQTTVQCIVSRQLNKHKLGKDFNPSSTLELG